MSVQTLLPASRVVSAVKTVAIGSVTEPRPDVRHETRWFGGVVRRGEEKS